MTSLLGWMLLGLLAQDGDKGTKKGDAPRAERKDAAAACPGRSRAQVAGQMRKEGLGGDDLEAFVEKHFKTMHPEGLCHCTCPHEKAATPECGRTARQILAEGGGKVDENKVIDHFRRFHPKNEACHCNCGHEKEPAKPEKGEKGEKGDAPPKPGEKR